MPNLRSSNFTLCNNLSTNIMASNIPAFDGSPTQLEFFFRNLERLQLNNNLTDNEIISHLVNKLEGKAKEFFITCPELQSQNIKLRDIKEKFAFYFRKQSLALSQFQYQNLKLGAGESVIQLSHKIDCLVVDIYPTITDKNALDSIKLAKLLESLPDYIRIDLEKENINKYHIATERAQTLLDISQNHITSSYAHNIDALQKSIRNIESKFDSILHKASENQAVNNIQSDRVKCDKSIQKRTKWYPRKAGHQNYQYNRQNSRHFPNYDRRNFINKPKVFCQYCGKPNHILKNCFKFQADVKNNKVNLNE